MRTGTFAANCEQFRAALCQNFYNLLFGFLKTLCCLCNSVAFNQDILSAEFIVRIASFRRVAVRLDAVMKIEDLG